MLLWSISYNYSVCLSYAVYRTKRRRWRNSCLVAGSRYDQSTVWCDFADNPSSEYANRFTGGRRSRGIRRQDSCWQFLQVAENGRLCRANVRIEDNYYLVGGGRAGRKCRASAIYASLEFCAAAGVLVPVKSLSRRTSLVNRFLLWNTANVVCSQSTNVYYCDSVRVVRCVC